VLTGKRVIIPTMPDNSTTQGRAGTLLAAAVGLVSAAVAIGVAELVAALDRSFRSPVLDVGDRVVDLAPPFLKDFAIEWFGTADKAALLIGIGVVLALFGVAIGLVAFRISLPLGVGGIALFGVLGVAAASGRGFDAAVPSVVGTLAAIMTLVLLYVMPARATTGDGSDADADGPDAAGRRTLLIGLGAAAGLAIGGGVGGRLWSRRFVVPMEQRIGALPPPARPLPPLPASADFGLAGLSPFVTPNDKFYKVDTALTVPQVTEADFLLRIWGMVDSEMTLTYQDLIERPQIESDITLACVSNKVGGSLVGNARWQGIRLDELLAEVGVHSGADQVVGRSVDGYTCGFPLAAAMDGRDAMVAIGMNGVRLPLEHGFPARLLVPGLYGYVSATKWLAEIELTTFDGFDHYWEDRGWDEKAPIKTQSRIDTPKDGQSVAVGPGVIAGVAWAPLRGVAMVEVQIDGGPWQEAELSEEVAATTWRQFHLPWDVTAGRHTVRCRATDGDGVTQPEKFRGARPNGAEGWHRVEIEGA
jgi:DMSO/TMAO reductase YedYZ molybdopterin-dependent catalytic subunit